MRTGSRLFTYTDVSASIADGSLLISGSATITGSNRIMTYNALSNKATVLTISGSVSRCPPWNKVIAKYAQDKYGLWGIGTLDPGELSVYSGYNAPIRGYHLYLLWSDMCPTSGAYAWSSSLDSKIQEIINAGYYVGIHPIVGQNSPSWVMTGSGYFYTTGGSDDGPYPVYSSSFYRTAFFQFQADLADHIYAYSQSIKDKIAYVQISEGSTGDTTPYHGTPVSASFAILDVDWATFRYNTWASASLYNMKNLPIRLLMNGGTNGEDTDNIAVLSGSCWNKNGKLSHDIAFDGEAGYFIRQDRFTQSLYDASRLRGEAQTFFTGDDWQFAPLNQTFVMAQSVAASGLDNFNIGTGWLNSNTSDVRPSAFINKYAGHRNAHQATRGFIGLKDVIDFEDTVRFPTGVHGVLIDPSKISQYNNATASVLSGGGSQEYIAWFLNKKIVDYINPARTGSITSSFMGTASFSESGYYNDFGYGMAKNFEKFSYQINPDNTSVGVYRYSGSLNMYGRYGRKFKSSGSSGGFHNMYFGIDPEITIPSGSNNLFFTVTYHDSGSGAWSLSCFGATHSHVNTGTNAWKTASLNVPDFRFGLVHISGSDYSLNYTSGSNTVFQMVEFDNLSKL